MKISLKVHPCKTVSLLFLIIFSGINSANASIDTITVQNFSFAPRTLVINQGDTVVWKLINGGHTTTSGIVVGNTEIPDGIWDSGNLTTPGQTFSFTFDSIGTYPYYCIPHGTDGISFFMVGVISVLPPGEAGQIVEISDFTFSPGTLNINKDEVVTWIIMEGMHSTTSGTSCTSDGIWDSGVMNSAGQTYSYTFNTNGIYPYYCIPHCVSNDMKGLILVDTVITAIAEDIITGIELFQNYPNPFNTFTIIEYQIPQRSFVEINIYDICGKIINTLVNEQKSAGRYKVVLDAADLPHGIYFYSIKTERSIRIKKMIH